MACAGESATSSRSGSSSLLSESPCTSALPRAAAGPAFLESTGAVPCPEDPFVGAEAAFTWKLFSTDFACPTAVVGAISSLSDSSLLEESTSGLWALLAVAGGDVQAGEAAVSAFQRAGVPTRAGGPLADAGVAGAPFLGEALV